ncbi:MAG TPA: hypothetical protein VIX19_14485 [Terriglobales bacterium]
MKKLLTVVFTMVVAGTLCFAQTGGGSTDQGKTAAPATSGKKATKTSKAHKGGKKSKKSTGATTTPAPAPK